MQNRNSVVSRNKSAIKQRHKLDSDLTVTGFLFHLEEMQYSLTPHDSIWCKVITEMISSQNFHPSDDNR